MILHFQPYKHQRVPLLHGQNVLHTIIIFIRLDLVPGVGPVPVPLDDHLDLGRPGPVLGKLDELLIVSWHQPEASDVWWPFLGHSPGQRMPHYHEAGCPLPSLRQTILNGWSGPEVWSECLENLFPLWDLLLTHVTWGANSEYRHQWLQYLSRRYIKERTIYKDQTKLYFIFLRILP